MAYQFPQKLEDKFQHLIKRYPQKRAVLLPILHDVQAELGYLTKEALAYVAERVELNPSQVREVASFYTMFRFEKSGTFVLQLCQTLSCYLRGGDDLVKHIENKLGIKPGETTSDGKFKLELVECLASCDTAPVMQVNRWDYHEKLDVEKLDQVLEALSKNKQAHESYNKRIEQGSVA